MRWMMLGALGLLGCDDGDPGPAEVPIDPTFPAPCAPVAACGGDLQGTWVWADWCRDIDAYAESLSGQCNEFTGTNAGLRPAGDMAFNADGSYRATTVYTHRREADLPPGCISPGCDREHQQFATWDDVDGSGEGGEGSGPQEGDWACVLGDYGAYESCDCISDTVLDGEWDQWDSGRNDYIGARYTHEDVLEDAGAGRWSVEGSTVTLINDAGRSRALWFCVDGDTLTLRDLRADSPEDPVFTLRRESANG